MCMHILQCWLHIWKYLYPGTERCNEALKKLSKKYDIVVNIQGDEPLVEPEIIDGVVKALQVIVLLLCIGGYVLIIIGYVLTLT